MLPRLFDVGSSPVAWEGMGGRMGARAPKGRLCGLHAVSSSSRAKSETPLEALKRKRAGCY